jgi:2-polyprenyl-6-methoxyphenol hydroxylase-like FAD-dependent oxidoreductase
MRSLRSPADDDVLILGAGPAGLFAALELARHGVRARVIERDPEPHHQARATALQPAVLELLAQAGVLERVLAESAHVRFARMFDAGLRPTAEMDFGAVACEWPFQCSLPQWLTERILTDRLVELGGTVEHGVEATSLELRDDHVRVALERVDGRVETIETAWLVGASGAHSVTRHSMDEELVGETYPGTALVADVRLSCSLPRDSSALVATPDGYLALAPLPGGRWINFVGDLDPAEVEQLATGDPTEAVAAAYARRAGDALRLDDVAWAAVFRMHHRVVAHVADGHRFLLGDAAHLSSPFGGEGLNSGLQDGQNLAWKLALELRGRARPSLLESFAPERLAAAQHVLEVSDRLHQAVRGAVEAARTGAPAEPASPEQAAALLRARCMLDVSYAGSPIVGEHFGPGGGPAAAPAPGDRYPGRVLLDGTAHHVLLSGPVDDAQVARLRERWRGVAEVVADDRGARGNSTPSAVLVRPDGHVGFSASPADTAGIRALDAHLDSYLVPN